MLAHALLAFGYLAVGLALGWPRLWAVLGAVAAGGAAGFALAALLAGGGPGAPIGLLLLLSYAMMAIGATGGAVLARAVARSRPALVTVGNALVYLVSVAVLLSGPKP